MGEWQSLYIISTIYLSAVLLAPSLVIIVHITGGWFGYNNDPPF